MSNRSRPYSSYQSSLPLTLFALAVGMSSCTTSTHEPVDDAVDRAGQDGVEGAGQATSIEELPAVEMIETVETFMQLLPEPTAQGENVAVHMRLPPALNEEMEQSLVRMIGTGESAVIAFRSSALAELGVVHESPGPEFFTAFLSLDVAELERRVATENQLAGAAEATERRIVFRGRTPIAITTGVPLDIPGFNAGAPVPLGPCPIMPASILPRWEESLMIIDPQVVQDPDRTHDFCGGGGNPDGVWTFKHLVEEMAAGVPMATDQFVVAWLEHWLNDETINGDHVPQRTLMFNEVIEPWANASGVSASLVNVGGTNVLTLGGPLDLDKAPFRLSAIVNRIDLGRTKSGGGGYGGVSSDPLDAGELRFIFGPQNLDTCQQLTFSVIFEYGVPIEGCEDVRDWAIEWTKLNDPGLFAPFSAPWLVHLEGLTESVVFNGAAPGRGNDNAINQVRTNEIQLDGIWELREFTLSHEDLTATLPKPPGTPDTPATGTLLEHTVAMTPDDSAFGPPSPSGPVDDFVINYVPVVGSGAPGDCETPYVVPADHPSPPHIDFRGGNAFTGPPSHWEANVSTSSQDLCRRHNFSLNTCNGCHMGDTDTHFFHVDPTVPPPAALSNFLTGGGTGGTTWNVPDTQFPGLVTWKFADLDRRFHRLYEIACTTCGDKLGVSPSSIEIFVAVAGVVPIDIGPGEEPPFPTGPIVSLDVVQELLSVRGELIDAESVSNVAIDGMVSVPETFVH